VEAQFWDPMGEDQRMAYRTWADGSADSGFRCASPVEDRLDGLEKVVGIGSRCGVGPLLPPASWEFRSVAQSWAKPCALPMVSLVSATSSP
jgi:hypothetical protein